MVVEQVGTANREVIAAVSNKNIFHMLQVGALENGAFLFLHAVPSFALPAAFFGSSARPSEPLSLSAPLPTTAYLPCSLPLFHLPVL